MKVLSQEAAYDLKHGAASNAATQNEIMDLINPDAPSSEYTNCNLVLEKGTASLDCVITVGASGAVTSFEGKGITSVVKESTDGQYTITLGSRFAELLSIQSTSVLAAVSDVARVQLLMAPSAVPTALQTTGELVIQCLDVAGVAVDAASGEALHVRLGLRWVSR